MLLGHGANLIAPAGFNFGATWLQIASQRGLSGLALLLLDKGAKLSAKRPLRGGRIAIEAAAESVILGVLHYLLLEDENPLWTPAQR